MKRDIWVLLFVVILFVASCATNFMFYKETHANRAVNAQLEADVVVAELIAKERFEDLQKLSKQVGFFAEGGSEISVASLIRDVRIAKAEDFKDLFETFLEDNLPAAAAVQDDNDSLPRLEHYIEFYVEQIRDIEKSMNSSAKVIEELKGQLSQARTQAADDKAIWEEEMEKRSADYQVNNEKLRKERNDLQTELEDEQRGRQEDVDLLNKTIKSLNKKNEALQKEYAKLEGITSTLRNLLGSNREKAVAVEADGKVIYVPDDMNTVYIDLTKEDRIYPGLVFSVYKERRDGTWVLKGKIEIKKVGKEKSEARIITLESTDMPISSGDLLVNVVFDPDKQYHIGFVGKITGSSKYDIDMLKYFVTASGGVVDTVVDAATDFVVVLSEPNPDDSDWITVKQLSKAVLSLSEFVTLFGN